MGVAPDVPADSAGQIAPFIVQARLFKDIQQAGNAQRRPRSRLMKLVVAKAYRRRGSWWRVAAYVASRFPPTQEPASTLSMK